MRRGSWSASVVLFAAIGLVPGAAAHGGEPEAGAERIDRLANGLRVVVRERRPGGVAAFRVYIAAGSLNEGRFEGAGVSHLLEHLVSGGTTANRSEAEVREALDEIGAMTNAHTSKQFVCYHGQAGAEHVDRLIEVIADTVMNAEIAQAEFEREFEVVQRELERAEANPAHVLWRLADETFFLDHPARHPVLGHLSLVRKLTRDELASFYGQIVRPENAVAVAVGDFDAGAVFETIRRVMGGWERGMGPSTVLPARATQVAPRRGEREMHVASVREILEYPTVRLTHPDLYPLDILAFVLGEGRASRLVSDLRDKRGLVQSVSVLSYTPAGYDGGRFAVLFQADPGSAEAARGAVLGHLARVVSEPISEEELARAKRQKMSEHVFGLQTCEDIATDLGLNTLLVGDPHFSDRYVENIQNVTAEEVQRVARAYLRPEVLCEAVVRPVSAAGGEGGVEEGVSVSAASAGPPIISRVLDNGVRVLVYPLEDSRTVSIRMVVRGGLAVESAENAGVSHLMAGMLVKGARSRSAEEIAAALDAMGARLSASSGRNTVYLSAECLAEDFDATFDLAADCMFRPSFPAAELENMRAQTLAGLAQMEDTLHGEGSLYFQRVFFTDSPYRFPVLGVREVVEGLARDDLAAWHQRLVAADNLVVAVFGGVEAGEALERVAAAVGDLPAKCGVALPRDVSPRKASGREVYIKPTGKKGAALVYVAYPGTDIFNVRDRFAMDVLDTVVSGYRMPGGWLHEELRGKGLVYEVHAYALAGLRPGYFAAYAVCQPQKVPEVVAIIEGAMERATREAFEASQLGPARAAILTAKELDRETIAGRAFEAALDEALGLGYGFAEAEIECIRRVSPGDVARVAREYLANPIICVVTSDADLAETIRK